MGFIWSVFIELLIVIGCNVCDVNIIMIVLVFVFDCFLINGRCKVEIRYCMNGIKKVVFVLVMLDKICYLKEIIIKGRKVREKSWNVGIYFVVVVNNDGE